MSKYKEKERTINVLSFDIPFPMVKYSLLHIQSVSRFVAGCRPAQAASLEVCGSHISFFQEMIKVYYRVGRYGGEELAYQEQKQ